MKRDPANKYRNLMHHFPAEAEGLHLLGLTLREDFQCDRVTIYLKAEHGVFVSVYAEGLEEMILAVKPGEGVVGKAIASRTPYVSNDALFDPNSLSRLRDHYSGYVTHSLLVVPIPGYFLGPTGAVQLVNKIGQPFDERDVEQLQRVVKSLRGLRKRCSPVSNNLWEQRLHKEQQYAATPSA